MFPSENLVKTLILEKEKLKSAVKVKDTDLLAQVVDDILNALILYYNRIPRIAEPDDDFPTYRG